MKLKFEPLTKDGVTYNFDPKYRKWTFTAGGTTLIQSCPGGRGTADKVASIVAGAVRRTGTIDGMARSNIARLTNA